MALVCDIINVNEYLELVDDWLVVKDPATLPKEALRAIQSMREHITVVRGFADGTMSIGLQN
jgi:hypothetical protein